MKWFRLVFSILIFLVIFPFSVFPQFSFSISSWNIGEIDQGEIARTDIIITNESEIESDIQVISTCGCLLPEISTLELEPGQSDTIQLIFDSTSEAGETEKRYLIQSTHPEFRRGILPVFANVIASQDMHAVSEVYTSNDAEDTDFILFAEPSCSHCREIVSEYLPRLNREYDTNYTIRMQNIFEGEIYEDYLETLSQLGYSPGRLPALVFEQAVFQGEAEVRQGIETIVSGEYEYQEYSEDAGVLETLSAFPILLAGLLDGINPCAFTTIIFLTASLMVAGRTRKEVLIMGISFTLAVFITYYSVGLGIFSVIRAAGYFPHVQEVIKYGISVLLLIFGVLSFRDFVLIKQGRTKEILLQLPGKMKHRIHRTVKQKLKSSAFIAASASLGFLITLFELACTGQVYLPALVYMTRNEDSVQGYLYLLLYNVGFVLPLIIVFTLTFFGVSSDVLAKTFKKQTGTVKLLLALLFFAFAGLILFWT
ncbi:MAG: DUF1573 domain-containing protein [Spirochaetia bacterium]